MRKSLRYWLLLLAALFFGLYSDAESVSKYVCEGDAVQLFENIKFANGSTVNLYINGERKLLIGTSHSIEKFEVVASYKRKVFLDKYGTIWILNVTQDERGKYLLQYNTNVMKSEVEIQVMVPPKEHCKPKIKNMDGILSASLEEKYCGTPSATVYWPEHPAITILNDKDVKLNPGKEVGTYIVCAESQALRCVKNIKISDYCTDLFIGGHNIPPKSSESSTANTGLFVTVGFLSVILVIVSISLISVIMHMRKDKLNMKPVSALREDIRLLRETMDINALKLDESNKICEDKKRTLFNSRGKGAPGEQQSLYNNKDSEEQFNRLL